MYDFITIDFETANISMNSACSVGLAAVKGNEIVKKDYFLIKPPTDHFRHENTDIHSLTFDDVKNSPTFDIVYQSIRQYIENSKYVMAHNAQFDMSVLHECLSYYHIPFPDFTYIDTINFVSQVKYESGNSLEKCADYFGIKISDHHNALCDAEVCAKIVIASINKFVFSSLESYLDFFPEVRCKQFSELNSTRTMLKSKKERFHNVKVSDIVPTVTYFDKSNAFYQKNCVLTGELESLDRKDAMQKIVDAGGIIKTGVSSKTDYLIVGIQDKRIVGDDGLSTKEEKAYELIKKGKNIKIINEDEFLELLQGKSESENEEELLILSPQLENLFIKIQELLDALITEFELPHHSLHLFSNISQKGANKGKEISKSICIYEPEYPMVKEDVNNPGKNFTVMNIKGHEKAELLIRNGQFDNIPLPDSAEVKELKSDHNFKHVLFGTDDDSVVPYIKENILYCLRNYHSKAKSFGCCSRFIECSDAKRCVHVNKLYSTSCAYRRNLEAGNIFYGKNKNV